MYIYICVYIHVPEILPASLGEVTPPLSKKLRQAGCGGIIGAANVHISAVVHLSSKTSNLKHTTGAAFWHLAKLMLIHWRLRHAQYKPEASTIAGFGHQSAQLAQLSADRI